MKTYLLTLVCYASLFCVFSCKEVPIQGTSPVTTTGQDLNSLAQQATQAWLDYQNGDVNYAWAATKGLYAYQTLIKTKDDFKKIVAAWSGDGTFAEKLARIFAASNASPEAKANVIANAVGEAAGKGKQK